MGEEVLLQMKDISKSFPGVKALDRVSLTVRKGNRPCPDGRERRWQVHTDEMPFWHLFQG